MGIIMETKKYEIFKEVKGNRNIAKANINNLKYSIEKNNLLEFNPIIVNEDMEVIDGQHRLEVAKILKTPIYYRIVKGLDLRDVQNMNSAQKNWSFMNFLNSYCEIQNENYLRMKSFIKKYNLPVAQGLTLLLGRMSSGYRNDTLNFKEGTIICVRCKVVVKNPKTNAKYCKHCRKEVRKLAMRNNYHKNKNFNKKDVLNKVEEDKIK